MITIEKISRKAFGITALLLAGGLTFSILSSTHSAFADKATAPNEDGHAMVSLLVQPSLALKIEVDSDVDDSSSYDDGTNAMLIRLSPNAQGTGGFTAIVYTNRDYDLQVNGADGNTTLQHSIDGTKFIPSTSSDGCTVATGTNCWGLATWDYTDRPESTTYRAIPKTPTRFTTGTGPTEEGGAKTPFEVGISTSSNIAAGTYKGKLVITASNK